MADEIAAALTQHDRVRRSTDIPLFYGKRGRDTVTPQQLIERLEKAQRIATWDEQRICDEFYMCLREGAMSWYNTLENIPDFNNRNWANITDEFMKAYAPRFTAKTLCTNFQDLRQKQDQNVQDYYNQVSDVFRDAYKIKPDHVINHPGLAAADRHGLTRAQANEMRMGGIMAMQLLMMNTVFIGGLREEIRSKVLEAGPTLIQESVDMARQIEVIVHDKKVKGATISSIEEVEGGSGEEDDDEVLEIINAVRARRGKPPYKFRAGQGKAGGALINKVNVQCHYCKIMGHFQRDCRKRIQAKAKMVFPSKVSSIGKNGDKGNDHEEEDLGGQGNKLDWNSLNY
jgi:hypothetical protein